LYDVAALPTFTPGGGIAFDCTEKRPGIVICPVFGFNDPCDF
jgi:hypothetical protein